MFCIFIYTDQHAQQLLDRKYLAVDFKIFSGKKVYFHWGQVKVNIIESFSRINREIRSRWKTVDGGIFFVVNKSSSVFFHSLFCPNTLQIVIELTFTFSAENFQAFTLIQAKKSKQEETIGKHFSQFFQFTFCNVTSILL